MVATARKRRLKNWIGLLLTPLVLFMFLRWFEHSQVYQPYRKLDTSPAQLQSPFEDIHFLTSDQEKLHAWFFPGETNSAHARLVFLICHGNGGNISHRLDLYGTLLKTGAAVFAFDYRGYGQSSGRPGEEGTYLDAQAAHRWLRERGFLPENIIAYGESLGGGVASELALREKIGGLVLHSAFTSTPDIGAELFPWLPVRWLSHIKYDVHRKLSGVHVPVLLLHGRHDSLVRFHHAQENFAAANEPKILVEISGDHNDGVVDPSQFAAALNQLLVKISPQ